MARVAPLLLLALLCAASCTPRPVPVLAPLQATEPKTPVVLVPGITGTRLRDADSGRLLWGSGRNVFFPRDDGYRLALPVGDTAATTLVPDGPVERLRLLGVLRFEFYARLIRLMQRNGYRYGDLDAPRPGDSFFIFDYDWRRGNVVTAAELASRLEYLRRARGEPLLEIDLICQSNAARIARYLVKYGGAPIDDALDGTARPPAALRVRKLILIGTDNGGALKTLLDLDRGRRYLPLLGRRFSPEALFTFRSLYEGLPIYRDDLFVDARGAPLDVDLFDAAAWESHGWGIYGERAARRVRRRGREDLFGDAAERAAFLADTLSGARLLQQALERDAPGFPPAIRYYLIQSTAFPTTERAVLVEGRRGWRTLFETDRRVRRDAALHARASAPGDTLATVTSQQWLSPQEQRAIAAPTVEVDARHRQVILHPETHRRILEFLADGAGADRSRGGSRARGRGSPR